MVVGEVVEYGNMFREEHEAGIRVQMGRFAGWVGPGLSWYPHREAMWQ